MFGVLILGLGLLLVSRRSSGSGISRYRLPDGRVVTEDMLPQLGYVYYQGYWIPQERLNQQTGSNYSSVQWQQIISSGFSIVAAGNQLWQAIQNAFLNNQFDDAILAPTDPPIDPYSPGGPGSGWA